jgi:hypothetical protein
VGFKILIILPSVKLNYHKDIFLMRHEVFHMANNDKHPYEKKKAFKTKKGAELSLSGSVCVL